MAIIAKSESFSSHWYTSAGHAAHKQSKANGDGDRATTIRDARKLKLLPSVTNKLSVLSRGGLVNWQLQQVGLAAFDSHPTDKESKDYYAKRIVSASKEANATARIEGSNIHQALHDYYSGKKIDQMMQAYILPIEAWRESKQLKFHEQETILVNAKRGYAGMCDVVGCGPMLQKFIVDWKSRTKIGKKVKSYETDIMQIAAYGAARWGDEAIVNRDVWGVNVYLCRTEVGKIEVKGYTPEEIFKAYQAFLAVTDIWRFIKGYDPRV